MHCFTVSPLYPPPNPFAIIPILAPPGFRQKNVPYQPSFRKLSYQVRASPFLAYAKFKFLQHSKLISMLIMTVVHVTVRQK